MSAALERPRSAPSRRTAFFRSTKPHKKREHLRVSKEQVCGSEWTRVKMSRTSFHKARRVAGHRPGTGRLRAPPRENSSWKVRWKVRWALRTWRVLRRTCIDGSFAFGPKGARDARLAEAGKRDAERELELSLSLSLSLSKTRDRFWNFGFQNAVHSLCRSLGPTRHTGGARLDFRDSFANTRFLDSRNGPLSRNLSAGLLSLARRDFGEHASARRSPDTASRKHAAAATRRHRIWRFCRTPSARAARRGCRVSK